MVNVKLIALPKVYLLRQKRQWQVYGKTSKPYQLQ